MATNYGRERKESYWKPFELSAQIKENIYSQLKKEKGIEIIEMPPIMFHKDEVVEIGSKGEHYLVEGDVKFKANYDICVAGVVKTNSLLIEVKDISIKIDVEKRIKIDVEIPSYIVDGDEEKLDLKLTTSFLG